MNHPSGIVPIKTENLTFGYDKDNILINDLTFDLSRGEKFLIVGENGIGKSTLLKLLIGYLEPLFGDITIGDKTEIGYYAQEHELLDNEKSIIDNFKNTGLGLRDLRSFLGNFLFSGEDVFKNVSVLSPGERSRVALAKLALTGANLLILDEPTNHLDPETQKIIADTFKNYEGTMLVVSHNLEFVDNLGIERMLMLPSGQIRYYDPEIVMYYQELNNIKK
jgi:ATP-binding cassette subfamily F protein 3